MDGEYQLSLPEPAERLALTIVLHRDGGRPFVATLRGCARPATTRAVLAASLVAGGVGFFSEAGERARLYWMRVSRNDDWLGHVCAMLAGGTGAQTTAWFGGPQFPGDAPVPQGPAGGGGSLAALWFGLPYLGAARKTRFLKIWRGHPWNT